MQAYRTFGCIWVSTYCGFFAIVYLITIFILGFQLLVGSGMTPEKIFALLESSIDQYKYE